MLKDFKEFAIKGNVADMAVGIIIGAAFGTIVTSVVNDILMPPVGLLLGNVDFSNIFAVLKDGKTPGPYPSLAVAKAAGAGLPFSLLSGISTDSNGRKKPRLLQSKTALIASRRFPFKRRAALIAPQN